MSKKEDVLALSKKGDISADGPALIKAARQRQQDQFADKVIAFVAGHFDQIRVLENQANTLMEKLEWMRDRVRAINDGKFSVNVRDGIVFDDPKYNEMGRAPGVSNG